MRCNILMVGNTFQSDPAAFYKYVNSFKKGKTKIGPLEDNHGNIVSDPKIMADIFNSSFSANFDTKSWLDDDKMVFVESLRDDIDKEGFLSDMVISTQDVLASIDTSKNNNSGGKDGLSSLVIKKLKSVVAPFLAEL